MYYLLLYILVAGVHLCVSTPCPAQSSTTLMGARGQAMGTATACLSDEWSVLNNVAGLARAGSGSVALTYDALPALPAFGKTGVAITLPGSVAFGVGLFRFGDDAYNEQIAAAGIATQWNHTSLGAKLNYIRYAADGLGSRSVFSASFGGITRLAPWVTVGAHIANINQPWLSKQYDERLPTTLTAGLLFSLAPQVIVATEVEKRINDVATGRVGLEFGLHEKFTARLGFQLNPQALSGGVGFRPRYFMADYSMMYVQSLGMRHQASVAFRWQKRKADNKTKQG